MDLKQEAARTGATLIVNQKKIGLGEGGTIGLLVAELAARPKLREQLFFSSSAKTKKMLTDSGLNTGELSGTESIDIYFDGCDQMDHGLNALKSGAGIHAMEKLVASMAAEFVLLGDESKYVPRFDGRFPLVVELIPEAISFAERKIKAFTPGVKIQQRMSGGSPVVTSHGNHLIDCWISDWEKGFDAAAAIKQLPGILDTSLFAGICKKAVIAGAGGTRIVTPVTS